MDLDFTVAFWKKLKLGLWGGWSRVGSSHQNMSVMLYFLLPWGGRGWSEGVSRLSGINYKSPRIAWYKCSQSGTMLCRQVLLVLPVGIVDHSKTSRGKKKKSQASRSTQDAQLLLEKSQEWPVGWTITHSQFLAGYSDDRLGARPAILYARKKPSNDGMHF